MEDYLSWSHANLFKILDLGHTWSKFFTFLPSCECLCLHSHLCWISKKIQISFVSEGMIWIFVLRSNLDRAYKKGTCLSHVLAWDSYKQCVVQVRDCQNREQLSGHIFWLNNCAGWESACLNSYSLLDWAPCVFLCQLSCKLPCPLITNESHLWPSPWKFYNL